MELIVQIAVAIVSALALFFAIKAWLVSKNANEISKKSNLIAEEAKKISEKSLSLDEHKMNEDARIQESTRREEIKPIFKCINQGYQGNRTTLIIKNIGRGPARNYTIEVNSDHDFLLQGGHRYDLFKVDIPQATIIVGEREKPYTLKLLFEDIDTNKYRQEIKSNNGRIDDEIPPVFLALSD